MGACTSATADDEQYGARGNDYKRDPAYQGGGRMQDGRDIELASPGGDPNDNNNYQKKKGCREHFYTFFSTAMDYFCCCICIPAMVLRGCCAYFFHGCIQICWKPYDKFASCCVYTDIQKDFRMKVGDLFKLLNTRKRPVNDVCNCDCYMEKLDDTEIQLFLTNVNLLKREYLYLNPANYYRNKLVEQMSEWLEGEFAEEGFVDERIFRNTVTGFFLKEKTRLIENLIETLEKKMEKSMGGRLLRRKPQAVPDRQQPPQQQQSPPRGRPLGPPPTRY